jgi:serine phosphatase RsbU (regulator of sigma subunit)
LFYGILDLNRSKIKYINAGHNYPIIIDKSGNFKRLKTTGPALGIISNANFEEVEQQINSGDLLFLFTDGLPESIDKTNQQYGEKSLIKILKEIRNLKSSMVIKEINKSLSDFSGDLANQDDVTFMAMKMKKIKGTDS